MAFPLCIIGVHPIPAREPCHLMEIELEATDVEFFFGSVTQEQPDQPRDNWQVAYDEQPSPGDATGSRWVFFFHCLVFELPLLTSFGPVELPEPTPLPDRYAVNAIVPAQYFAGSVDNVAGAEIFGIRMGLHQRLIVTEADVLALRTISH